MARMVRQEWKIWRIIIGVRIKGKRIIIHLENNNRNNREIKILIKCWIKEIKLIGGDIENKLKENDNKVLEEYE